MIPGAEEYRADGGPVGVLVLHGFTANPSSVRPLAEAFAAEGHAVEAPRLAGHGTDISDLMLTGWPDWSADAETALADLAVRTEIQFVAGLSMGGALACWLATRHPGIRGLICINPPITADLARRRVIQALVDAGETVIAGNGSDIADPDAVDSAYPDTPVAPLLSLLEAARELGPQLARITQPLLLFNSVQDHVVPPADSDQLAEAVAGPVERVMLERSYHVATRDYDADLINERSVEFVARHAR